MQSMTEAHSHEVNKKNNQYTLPDWRYIEKGTPVAEPVLSTSHVAAAFKAEKQKPCQCKMQPQPSIYASILHNT